MKIYILINGSISYEKNFINFFLFKDLNIYIEQDNKIYKISIMEYNNKYYYYCSKFIKNKILIFKNKIIISCMISRSKKIIIKNNGWGYLCSKNEFQNNLYLEDKDQKLHCKMSRGRFRDNEEIGFLPCFYLKTLNLNEKVNILYSKSVMKENLFFSFRKISDQWYISKENDKFFICIDKYIFPNLIDRILIKKVNNFCKNFIYFIKYEYIDFIKIEFFKSNFYNSEVLILNIPKNNKLESSKAYVFFSNNSIIEMFCNKIKNFVIERCFATYDFWKKFLFKKNLLTIFGRKGEIIIVIDPKILF